jgi:hypothetical protein
MNAPLTREQQIELMRDAPRRLHERMRAWLRDKTFREVVSEPAPHQEPATKVTRRPLKVSAG